MVKTPDFDEPAMFGASWEGKPKMAPELLQIGEGAIVDLRYKGKVATIQVTKVIAPQGAFEGMIESFDRHELAHEDLSHGEVVRFAYDRIQHIHSTKGPD